MAMPASQIERRLIGVFGQILLQTNPNNFGRPKAEHMRAVADSYRTRIFGLHRIADPTERERAAGELYLKLEGYV